MYALTKSLFEAPDYAARGLSVMGHRREGACNDAVAYLIVYQLGDRLHERLGEPLQGK